MIIRPEAEADLAGAKAYYDGQREGLGEEFLRADRLTLASLERMPEAYRVVLDDVRKVRIKRFPFGVFYSVVGGEVIVMAVFLVAATSCA